MIQSTTNLGFYHTLGDLTGSVVTVADLIRHLGTMRRSDVICVIAGMSAAVWSDYGMSLRYQLQMARHFLPDDVFRKAFKKMSQDAAHPGRLFHRRQLWFLLQMAIISCGESGRETEPIELQKKVGLAALMASDVLNQIERTHMPSLADAPSRDQWVATAMIPLVDHYIDHEMICRAMCFWVDSQDDHIVRRTMDSLGLEGTLDSYLYKEHGLTLRELVLILAKAYWVFKDGASSVAPEVHLLEPASMGDAQFTADQVRKAFQLAGIAPDKLAPLLLGARQSWATDFSPIRRKPLIEVYPGSYICADVSIFSAFFMDGIYDILQEVVPSDNVRSLFGVLFERYVNTLFEQFLCGAPPLVRRFAADPKFVGSAEDQAGDGVILLNDITVLMEYKGGMLSRRQKYATNIREAIDGIDSLLAKFGKGKKGVGQLIENIDRILKGEKLRVAAEELDIPATSKIVPALVVYDDSLGLHAIRNHVEEKFLAEVRKRALPEDRIGPVCVLTTRDIESIQEYSSVLSVEEIFKKYFDHLVEYRDDHMGSFHGFVTAKYGDKRPRGSFVQGKVQSLIDYIVEQMAGGGM